MKLSEKAAAALDRSDTKTLTFEMTPQLKERYNEVAAKLIDWLKANTESPVEAYMVMVFTIQALEETGIRGSIIVGKDDLKH